MIRRMKLLALSSIIWHGVLILAGFLGLTILVGVSPMIVFLNGVTLGLAVGLTYLFGRWLWLTLTEQENYDRASRMLLGVLLHWVSFFMARSYNVTLRAADVATPAANNLWVVTYIFLALVAGYLQITSPSFRMDGLTYEKDTKVINVAMAIGVLVGAVAVVVQVFGVYLW